MGSGVCACLSGARCRASRSWSRNPASASFVASSSDAPPAMNSCHRSSRCCESSSMISFSRDDDRRSDARRGRMCGFQSGMFPSRDEAYGLDEVVPGSALSGQYALTGRCQAIEAAPSLARLLDPRPLDPAALLEAIEQRIERVEVEHQPPARLRLDQLGQFIAVSG